VGLVGRLVGRRSSDTAPTNKSRLSQGGLAIGLLGAICCGWPAGVGGFVDALAFGLAFGLIFGLIFGMVGEVRAERTTPNEAIRRSARHALVAGLAVLLVVELGPLIGGVRGLTGLAIGLLVWLPFALLVGLVFGGIAWLRHYVVRAWLTRTGVAPWRYGSFLEAMTQRSLLRRSGSAYLFVHRLLRDHLAELDSTPITGEGHR
jgi:hypothetical protein